jgi:hypothetical protein
VEWEYDGLVLLIALTGVAFVGTVVVVVAFAVVCLIKRAERKRGRGQ